jgi:hypothetical protein
MQAKKTGAQFPDIKNYLKYHILYI